MDDATFSSNGPGCVDVITSHHPNCDARTLTLADGFRHLGETGKNTKANTLKIQVRITYYWIAQYQLKLKRDTHKHTLRSAVPQAAQGPLSRPQWCRSALSLSLPRCPSLAPDWTAGRGMQCKWSSTPHMPLAQSPINQSEVLTLYSYSTTLEGKHCSFYFTAINTKLYIYCIKKKQQHNIGLFWACDLLSCDVSDVYMSHQRYKTPLNISHGSI